MNLYICYRWAENAYHEMDRGALIVVAASEEQAAEVYRMTRYAGDSPARIEQVEGVTATGEARDIYDDEYR